MYADPAYKPRLRSVEAFQVSDGNGELIGLRDPSGLSDISLTMSAPALQILSMMDGSRTCEQLHDAFQARFGQSLAEETLQTMIEHLERAHFLEGDAFDAHYRSLVEAYRQNPTRGMPHAEALGIDASGDVFDQMLAGEEATAHTGVVRGLIAPHLDYPRGWECYAAAYSTLRGRPVPDRVVVLGTNHFGRATSVVATTKDFCTPLGTTRADAEFVGQLEDRCGSLRNGEIDHAREHSVELQVAWLQHIFGPDSFTIVPVLCPDPCGPTGTGPYDGNGVDLRDFATAMRELIAAETTDTLIVAGADLSHVGRAFGDDRDLDDTFLERVRGHDRAALEQLETDGAEAFLRAITENENETRICSAGCIFTIAQTLPGATINVLRYHQTVDRATQTCVSCAAAILI